MNVNVDLSSLIQVVDTVKSGATAKFIESVDLAVNSTVSKKSGTSIKTYTTLPYSISKEVRVAVITDDAKQVLEAREAGADTVGYTDLLSSIMEGVIDFDILISTTAMMPKISKAAKILGPKGLMPNAKLGTLTDKIGAVVKEVKAGRVYLKSDDFGTIHVKVGNVSMSANDVLENIVTVLEAINNNAGSNTIKHFRIKSVFINSTMGKGYQLNYSILMSKKW